MKTVAIIALSASLVSVSQAETFTKTRPEAKPDYSAYADGPTISVEGRQFQFLPQARSELSSRSSSSTLRPPALISVNGTSDNSSTTPSYAPSSSQGTGEYLTSKGRYDIYLETNALSAQASGADVDTDSCGYCQVLYNPDNGQLALFTNDISVRLQSNDRATAERLAQEYGLSLKYYMQRIGMAVYTAESAEVALNMKTQLESEADISRVRHSIVEHEYEPQ